MLESIGVQEESIGGNRASIIIPSIGAIKRVRAQGCCYVVNQRFPPANVHLHRTAWDLKYFGPVLVWAQCIRSLHMHDRNALHPNPYLLWAAASQTRLAAAAARTLSLLLASLARSAARPACAGVNPLKRHAVCLSRHLTSHALDVPVSLPSAPTYAVTFAHPGHACAAVCLSPAMLLLLLLLLSVHAPLSSRPLPSPHLTQVVLELLFLKPAMMLLAELVTPTAAAAATAAGGKEGTLAAAPPPMGASPGAGRRVPLGPQHKQFCELVQQ